MVLGDAARRGESKTREVFHSIEGEDYPLLFIDHVHGLSLQKVKELSA